MKKPLLFIVSLLFFTNFSYCTTWDEPWHNEVVKQADYFVLAEIQSVEEDEVKLRILKIFGGGDIREEISITNFYLLDLCSISGGYHKEFFISKKTKRAYFLLKKNEKGEFMIATPTSGFAEVSDGKVVATYRHSYHQALVPEDVYEKTMLAIFNHYHNIAYDAAFIEKFVSETLHVKPAGFTETELPAFFLQHVALELIYHLRLNNKFDLITPYIGCDNFHSQVSAVRALIAQTHDETVNKLVDLIAGDEEDFVKVIAVWTLQELDHKSVADRLAEITKSASGERTGFGGNIMDPRVCTRFPSVKGALDKLLGIEEDK